MKVKVTSATNISREGLLDKDSGVIEFPCGEITHVLYEKQMQKAITVIKDAPKKEEPKVEAKEEMKEEASPEQSKEGNKKKTKTK